MPKRSLAKPLGAALAWLALVPQLLVLYLPDPHGLAAGLDLPYADKAVHAFVFALAAGLWAAVSGRVWLVGALFAAHAVVSEVVQATWLPQRSGDPWDVAADLAGIAFGLWLAARPALLWRRPRPTTPGQGR
ncbi:MAG: hypothetical protein LBC97_06045 [Bifidobacteriaceae bacterium]|nr:hypothetical protein [Bifidobacteriaceae bacterium]